MSCVTRRPTKPYLAMTATGSNATDGTGRLSSRTPCSPAGSGLSPGARWLVAVVALAALAGAASAETWGGLTVAPEHRCSPCDRKRDYHYPQSVEQDIVRELGAVYGPYTETCFDSTRDTDIEHMVATSEAHASRQDASARSSRAGTSCRRRYPPRPARSGAGQARRLGLAHLSPQRCSRSIVIGSGLEPARRR